MINYVLRSLYRRRTLIAMKKRSETIQDNAIFLYNVEIAPTI